VIGMRATARRQGEKLIATMLRGRKRMLADGDIERRKRVRSDARERQSAVRL